ncbi:MAG: hypothetical protein RIT24_2167 [Planctomycetota bacterium]
MKVKPKINAYAVIMRAVEEGIAMGVCRADKHADDPLTLEQRERVKYHIEVNVAAAISEVVNFD